MAEKHFKYFYTEKQLFFKQTERKHLIYFQKHSYDSLHPSELGHLHPTLWITATEKCLHWILSPCGIQYAATATSMVTKASLNCAGSSKCFGCTSLNPHKKSYQGHISIMLILKMIQQRLREVKQLSQNCNCKATYTTTKGFGTCDHLPKAL